MRFVTRVILECLFDPDLWLYLRKSKKPDEVSFPKILFCLTLVYSRGKAWLEQAQDAILFFF